MDLLFELIAFLSRKNKKGGFLGVMLLFVAVVCVSIRMAMDNFDEINAERRRAWSRVQPPLDPKQ